jgi:hypothetical protein
MPNGDLNGVLDATEAVFARIQVAGFHASKHFLEGVTEVVLTNSRYVVLRRKGLVKKRLELAASWPYRGFTERINTSEGAALGPYLHLLTLFATDDETISAGFRTAAECEAFKMQAATAVGGANGWT